MNPEKKKGSKKWLTVGLAAILAAVTAAGQAGIVPPVVADLLMAVGGVLQPSGV